MRRERLRDLGRLLMISAAVYPIVFVGAWGLLLIGSFATGWNLPADATPLLYGLAFAVLTVALYDILGLASVVLALIASANLIEYSQLIIPGRSASMVDYAASLFGVVFAAALVAAAKALAKRSTGGASILEAEGDKAG